MTKLFVYGTLLQGLSRARMLRCASFLGPALTAGRLFDLGSYPGLVPGQGLVVGEVYAVDLPTLKRIDRVEDFDPLDSRASLYRRQMVKARYFSGGYENVATYQYNRVPCAADRISHGDYRRYRLEREYGAQPAVAYGSNLSRARIEGRIGPVGPRRTGSIPGFRLSLDKRASTGTHVVANLRHTGADNCPAALHYLSLAQLQAMDRFEGTPDHYLRIALPFRQEDGSIVLAQTWIAHPDRLTAGLPAREAYLHHLNTGYQEFGWPTDPILQALAELPRRQD